MLIKQTRFYELSAARLQKLFKLFEMFKFIENKLKNLLFSLQQDDFSKGDFLLLKKPVVFFPKRRIFKRKLFIFIETDRPFLNKT